jgi:hypothetical protein
VDHRFGGVHSIRRSISQRGCPEAASCVEALRACACAQQDAAKLPVLAQLLPAESVSPSRSASDGIASAKSGMAGEPRIALLGLSRSLNLCDLLGFIKLQCCVTIWKAAFSSKASSGCEQERSKAEDLGKR